MLQRGNVPFFEQQRNESSIPSMKSPLISILCSKQSTLISCVSRRMALMLAIMALFLTVGTGQAVARVLGIDVSRFQNTINWTSVAGSGVTFAWAQATRGAYLTNVNYVANMNNGKAAGVIMGPYHYATPATNSAITEANYFWALAGPHILADGKTLMPMLDIEEFNGHIGATSYADWATQWVNAVTAKAASNGVSITIILYSSASFMCNFDSSLSTMGNDVANYNGQDPQTGTPWSCCSSCNLWGGSSWDFWQYTSTGTIPGISGNVDHDVFNGTSISAWIATPVGAPIISNVSADNLSDVGATITWNTDVNSDSVVNYGLTTSYGTTSSNSTMVVNHSRTLTGLSASTTYHYRVKSKNTAGQVATSGDFTFTTLAAGQVSDIIIDNTGATVVGTWSTGTGSTDKFGTDYRFKSGGTGAAYLQFTPTVLTAGDYEIYEWHPQGANRTIAAPVVIAYNGGTTTVPVNQQGNGGVWNLLGTFNFAVGSAGNIKITDNYADSANVVMADAVKLVYAPATVVAPSAPSGLSATAISASQINLAWTDNSNNEDNFIVSRSTTSGGPYTDVATLAANVTSFSNTGLAGNTTYYYVVRASNTAGSSANSNQASATTPLTPPTAPSGLSASAVSSSQINLSWTDNSSNESGFVIGRATTSGGPYSDVATLGVNVTSFNNTGLSASTTYYYVVRAYNAAGSSANSAQASATTFAVAPAAPSGLAATAVSSSQINLSWVDNSSNENNFIVARSTTVGGPYTDIATLGANVVSYSNTGLSGSTTYYYVVRASNTGGSSLNSNEASATTAAPTPSAPSGLTATAASSSQINLSWTDNSSIETGFVVARGTVSGGPYTDIVTTAANVTSYSNTGLSASTTYYYVVRAFNGAGSSANSAQASATTLPLAPVAPSALAATASSASQIDLTWADNSANETSFVVARSTTTGGPYSDVVTLAANTSGYSDTGLSASTTYFYVVRAANSGGSSANSNEASATTQAATTDIIVDNPAATVVGTWVTASLAPDRFGADYRYKSQGTGSAYLQFAPTIATAGSYQVYEWHSQGSNRSLGAPHIINYNGGSQTINVNQQVNGGLWSSLGIYSFAAGTAGNVRINDAFSDAGAISIADAVRFVYLPPASVVHVKSITMSWVASGTKFKTKAVVNVVDGNGNAVSGVTVTGNFSGSISNPGMSAVTGAAGNASITSTTAISHGTVTFTVVSLTGTYDATANLVNSATISR
ncbi:MAG: hypothetical protein JWM68_2623 [Verrucomicrobiales bacterium]|nr:hypothetical protein [Verrucomicrobiales bacterium]